MITLKAQNIMLILKHIKLYFEILKQILCKMHIFSMHGKRLYGGNPQKSLKWVSLGSGLIGDFSVYFLFSVFFKFSKVDIY